MDAYDRQGRPISMDEWGRLLGDRRYKVVAQHQMGECMVSTVWLGFDHGWGDRPAPIIFETLVFGGPLADEMVRYSTEAQAFEGHAVMVARAAEAQGLTMADLKEHDPGASSQE